MKKKVTPTAQKKLINTSILGKKIRLRIDVEKEAIIRTACAVFSKNAKKYKEENAKINGYSKKNIHLLETGYQFALSLEKGKKNLEDSLFKEQITKANKMISNYLKNEEEDIIWKKVKKRYPDKKGS